MMRVLALVALLPLAACGAASDREGPVAGSSPTAAREAGSADTRGTAATRSWELADFTGVELRGSDDVEVTIGDGFAVRAEGDSETLDRLEVGVVEGRLRIARRSDDRNWFGSRRGARVYVTMPRVTSASVSGSGDMTVARAEGSFRGAVSGSGNLALATIAAEDAALSVSGSGDISAAGRTGALTMSISGSGDIDARGLTATSAQVSVAGSGDATATVTGTATISIVGSGDVDLGGGARCTVNRAGSGSANCG